MPTIVPDPSDIPAVTVAGHGVHTVVNTASGRYALGGAVRF
ncbi:MULTISPECIES: hypothetical protein [Dietzia]|uniref:Uncharacterized protein n=1 Tax=Dietzia maris TaxID=37915 RepID=A0AAE4U549_9ACTN|nr:MULTISPECIES: hypothetical protein [Dietzia]MCY1659174.1 hypothetical protein [Dietzia sp. SL131]MCZ4539179.1 hypothetical protein [Dietzia maris]MCZ4654555.1 hypothetical protein [Dietzia kunjamensis]MDN4506974.1 hypothetical protein [Dietzia maris]MDV3356602.1 hypothetical protein [Dietzia sp. IN118]